MERMHKLMNIKSTIKRIKLYNYILKKKYYQGKLYFNKDKTLDYEKVKKKHGIKQLFYEEYKNNNKYSQQIGDKTDFNKANICNIRQNVYYENITFHKTTFSNFTLNHVCFHNCKFVECKFINITTYLEKDFSSFSYPIQGFSCCDFTFCNFENCNLNQLFFSIGTLKCVDFKNTTMQTVIFQMNAFSQVRFIDSCSLYNVFFASPSRMFDITFVEKEGKIAIDEKSAISGFRYRDMVNISDLLVHNIYKRLHFSNVASTYYSFEQLLANNYLMDKKSNCFYQRKKAETRSKPFPKSIPGYIAEISLGYGEYPFRSILSLILITLLYAPIYMLTGFDTGQKIIKYSLDLSFFIKWSSEKISDLLESIYYSFFTIITVGQGTPSPTSALTKFFSSIELLIGAILITAFTATLFRKITK